MEPGKAAFVLFLSEKYCRVPCSMKSIITSTITEDRAVPGAAFALHSVGEGIIKSFVLSVTRYRHRCAFHSCQPQCVQSDSPKHPETTSREGGHPLKNFHPAFLFLSQRPEEGRCPEWLGSSSAGKYPLQHTPSKAAYGPAEMRLAPTLSVCALHLPPTHLSGLMSSFQWSEGSVTLVVLTWANEGWNCRNLEGKECLRSMFQEEGRQGGRAEFILCWKHLLCIHV